MAGSVSIGACTYSVPTKDASENIKNITQAQSETNFSEEDIKKEFEDIFKNNNVEYSIDKLCELLGERYTRDVILCFTQAELENAKYNVENAFYESKYSKEVCNIAKNTGYSSIKEFDKANKTYKPINTNNIKNEIIEKYAKENNCEVHDFNEIPKEYVKKQFGLILANTSDDDKLSLLKFVINDLKDNELLELLFSSFKDKDKLIRCADSISFEEFYKIEDDNIRTTLTKNMSYARTGKLLSELKEDAQNYYLKNKEVLDRVFTLDDSQITNENDLKIKYEFLEKIGVVASTQLAIHENKNLTEEEKENLTKKAFDIFKDTPFQEVYIEKLADLFSKSELPKELKDLFDKYTDNKFSEKYNEIPEKTAIDEKTGGFKTDADAAAQAAIRKDEQQTILANNIPKEDKSFVIEKNTPEVDNVEENSSSTESFFEKYGQKFTVKLFTGKIKTFSSLEESLAINNYKRMDVAQQGKLLQASIGKFCDKLIENTKTYTLENLLACGWKGKTFSITKEVEETVEERKEKLNNNSLT